MAKFRARQRPYVREQWPANHRVSTSSTWRAASHDPNYFALAIPLEPGAAARIRLGVELAVEAFGRDPEATLARLADVAARGGEPFEVPSELLVSEY